MNLETLKIALSYLGIVMSLIFGIIGTTFETKEKDRDGKSRPTRWLWIALVGLVISATISGVSSLIDNKLKDIENTNSRIKQRKQDSISQIITGNLSASLKQAETLRKSLDSSKAKQDKSLRELQGINKLQLKNAVQQQVVLENTKKALAPALYPLQLGIHYIINYKRSNVHRNPFLDSFVSQINEERHYTNQENIPKGLIKTGNEIWELRPPYDLFHHSAAFGQQQGFAINLNSYSKCGDTVRRQIGPIAYLIGMRDFAPNSSQKGSFNIRINFKDSVIDAFMIKPFEKMLQANIDSKDYDNLYDLIGAYLSVKGGFFENVQLKDVTFIVGNGTLRRIYFDEHMKCSNAQSRILYEKKMRKQEIEHNPGTILIK